MPRRRGLRLVDAMTKLAGVVAAPGMKLPVHVPSCGREAAARHAGDAHLVAERDGTRDARERFLDAILGRSEWHPPPRQQPPLSSQRRRVIRASGDRAHVLVLECLDEARTRLVLLSPMPEHTKPATAPRVHPSCANGNKVEVAHSNLLWGGHIRANPCCWRRVFIHLHGK